MEPEVRSDETMPGDPAGGRETRPADSSRRGSAADLPRIGVPAEALADARGSDLHQCDNCQTLWPASALAVAGGPPEQGDEDGPPPSGECPACGALCHPASEIDGVSAEGRAARIGAEMGGVMGDVHVRPATSGPCEAGSLDTPDHVPGGLESVRGDGAVRRDSRGLP
jgi:hypothetical protein